MNDLVITKELDGLEKSKAEQIEAVFAPMVKMLKEFEGAYEEVMALEQSEEKCARAKRLRIDISKIRIEADKVRKAEKAEYLRAGNAIQGVYNILRFAVEDKENNLKDIETYYERIEKERIAKIQTERVEALAEYEVDGSTMDLGNMADDVWVNLLAGSKANHKARIDAERKSEEERAEAERKMNLYRERRDKLAVYARHGAFDLLTEETTDEQFAEITEKMVAAESEFQAEQDRIRKENEKIKAEQEKAAAEIAKKEAAIKKERERREEAERKVAEEKAAAERKAKEEEAEKKRQIEREAARSDGEKLAGWADALEKKADDLASEHSKKAVLEAANLLRGAVVVAA